MINLDRRWVKVLHDLWMYKSRTFIVITAIAIGVTGVGMVATTQIILLENYLDQYRTSNAADATLNISPFGEGLLRNIRKLPEIVATDARHVITTREPLNSDNELPLTLQVIPDFNAISIDRLAPMPGAQLPPPNETVLLALSGRVHATP